MNARGEIVDTAESAFDVLDSWTSFPRYGFLSDFAPGVEDVEAALESLAMYHINGLQFYDWQFRHDSLLPPTELFEDPLGRELSLGKIRSYIQFAHQFGMAAMPYLAVYAASLGFWREHAKWALYDEQGEALSFVDFLGLMDPTAGRPWSIHLLNECKKVLAALPFDGLHVDQYGEHFGDEDGKPKKVFDAWGTAVDIPEAFSQFIHSLRAAHPMVPVTFNAVGNWPIAALAAAPQDFVYIEIWPPSTSYLDLVEIVLNARRLSGDKAVIIALYLPASRTANIRLADALIFSSGGARIELGDKERLLSDPYFPNHQALSPELKAVLRRYYDFAVRYQELFGPAIGSVPISPLIVQPSLQVPEGIWYAVRQSPGRLTVCLVNLYGLNEPRWDIDHTEPQVQKNGRLTLFSDQCMRQVLWATPDSHDSSLRPIDWQLVEKRLEVNLPELIYWAILVFELDEEKGTKQV